MHHDTSPDQHMLSRLFGWPVGTDEARFALRTGQNFCAIAVPRAIGDRMSAALREVGGEGPVVGIRRGAEHHVFLAEADAVVGDSEVERRGGLLLYAGDHVDLPCPAVPATELFWIVAPSLSRRWLPTLSTLLWALPATSASTHSRRLAI